MLRYWHEFLFQKIDVRQYALLRIGLGSLIVLYLINLMPLFPSQFGPEGWLDAKTDLDLYHAGSWSILFLIESTVQAQMFFWLVLVSALAFTAGFLTRTTGFITLVGLISLWNRNPLIMDGDDALLRITLFYLLLSPSGNALSIDVRLRQRKRSAEIWPLRMIRAQLILVYFISGWVKFHSPEWLDGTVLQYVLIHPEYSRWNMSGLMEYPFFLHLLGGLSFLVMWWELLFPILVLWRFSRSTAIIAGVAFHTALLLLMHLRLFSVIMLVLYIAWIPQPLPAWIAKTSKRIKPPV